MAMLTTRELSKTFGERVAVESLSIEVDEGEIVGLLGPNGAGKTTSLSMICGTVAPTSGTVEVAGYDPATDRRAAQSRIGVAPQELALYEQLSARHNLEFFAALYGLSGARLRDNVRWALDVAGLSSRANERVRTYSGGMKRRLNLACAVVHTPTVVILDEPTVGVDPHSRNLLFEVLERLAGEGMAILYASHYMEEVERLCDRVYILDHGSVIAAGHVRELLAGHVRPLVEIDCTAELTAEAIAALATIPDATVVEPARVVVPVDGEIAAVFGALRGCGVQIGRVATMAPTLEGLFLDITGKSVRD